MKLNKKDLVKPVLVLFIICLVVTLALAVTNQVTKSKIAQANLDTERKSQQQVLPQAEAFAKKTAFNKSFVVGTKGGKIIGYVFTTSEKSYGGNVKVMTGISTEGKVTGVQLLETSDTPGLGLNAQKDSFRDQYKQAVPAQGFTVNKSGQHGNGQIAALTGATITSNAVTKAVNDAVKSYQSVKGGA